MKRKRRFLLSGSTVILLLLVLVPAALAGDFHFNTINFSIGHSLLFEGHSLGWATRRLKSICSPPGPLSPPARIREGTRRPGGTLLLWKSPRP